MSLVVDNNGNYKKKDNGRVEKSNHEAYRARISLALPKNKWLFAPNKGHTINEFQKKRNDPNVQNELEKEVRRYLSPYDPDIVDQLISDTKNKLKLTIEDVDV